MKEKKVIKKEPAVNQKADLMNESTMKVMKLAPDDSPKGKCPMRFIAEDDNIKNVTFKKPGSSIEESYMQLQNLTSTQDIEIAAEIFDRGMAAMPNTHNLSHKSNMVVQSLADTTPKDSVEAKLCMQETVLYAQGMQYLARAENAERLENREFYMKNAIKLLRLHNETIEAMMKYRRGGEQRVVVQHMNINGGAQAIIGNVNIGGRENKKSDEVIP